MSDLYHSRWSAAPQARVDMGVDAGLRGFMLGVYNKVAAGLVVSAVLASLTSSVPAVRDLMFLVSDEGRLIGVTPLGWIVAFAPVAILFVASLAMRSLTSGSASLLYWIVVGLIGASLGV